jgi:uncharacterized protein (TIGR02145 family)
MKTSTFIIALLSLASIGLFAQSGLNIRSGGAVTVNGNLIITPQAFVCGTPLTDLRDGKTYNTVLIGTQCWMAQNLNIGSKILVSENQTNNGVIEKYCYGNADANCAIYGGLYQWDEAMQYSTIGGVQGICPASWHLPSDAEWITIEDYLGGGIAAGGKMKETGYTHWSPPNAGANNSSGFTALAGGYREYDGTFNGLLTTSFFWSSSQNTSTFAWGRYIDYDYGYLYRYIDYDKLDGFSIRCIKN